MEIAGLWHIVTLWVPTGPGEPWPTFGGFWGHIAPIEGVFGGGNSQNQWFSRGRGSRGVWGPKMEMGILYMEIVGLWHISTLWVPKGQGGPRASVGGG